MKTILQKHTRKFIANLINGLGIIACVSLTACGEEKGNNDGDNNEVETLKSALKNKFENLNDSEFEKIAKSLKRQGKSDQEIKKMRVRIPKILSKLKMEKFIWMVSTMI